MKIFPIFKNLQKQNPIFLWLFLGGFTIIALALFAYPFYLIQIIDSNNWKILEIFELLYWLFLSIISMYIGPQFLILNYKEKKTKKKKLFEKIALTITLIIGFGLIIVFGIHNVYAIGKDILNGTENYFGECSFTYSRGKRSTYYYVILEDGKKLQISSDNYSNFKSLESCRVVYLPNSEKILEIKNK